MRDERVVSSLPANRAPETQSAPVTIGHGTDGSLAAARKLGEYIDEYMATTVHLPRLLLAAADRRARALRISRNRLIMLALQRELSGAADWSPAFLARLRAVGSGTGQDVDDLLSAVKTARRSKTPPRL